MIDGTSRTSPLLLDTDSITAKQREAQIRCILDRWQDIASLAWEGFQREGRGVVALRMEHDCADIIALIYISERSLHTQGVAWPDHTTAFIVADYQPKTQVVVVTERAGVIDYWG